MPPRAREPSYESLVNEYFNEENSVSTIDETTRPEPTMDQRRREEDIISQNDWCEEEAEGIEIAFTDPNIDQVGNLSSLVQASESVYVAFLRA
mmetsp:Transcript_18506/g.28564  ORF Transcript_18506/g.28564 Transcript_18506/m.28564 type:complete len:93 (-) Transcript_18506:385-663(-)|eukprot:CAMPEP_0195297082 /NCGR_PEP_ID=MMETSP0707-20130614/20794_1 /TAXON_ID=33640 /ORGANISM="Asterionellopsis glacialis, Strain CCMP134" /LENGTH=92 /DNA_ID=CAMNT_0040358783 /DNA_START=66 /DNA_END=344 /DNA_ORIENTATION=+